MPCTWCWRTSPCRCQLQSRPPSRPSFLEWRLPPFYPSITKIRKSIDTRYLGIVDQTMYRLILWLTVKQLLVLLQHHNSRRSWNCFRLACIRCLGNFKDTLILKMHQFRVTFSAGLFHICSTDNQTS